jgi:hypothetical protein
MQVRGAGGSGVADESDHIATLNDAAALDPGRKGRHVRQDRELGGPIGFVVPDREGIAGAAELAGHTRRRHAVAALAPARQSGIGIDDPGHRVLRMSAVGHDDLAVRHGDHRIAVDEEGRVRVARRGAVRAAHEHAHVVRMALVEGGEAVVGPDLVAAPGAGEQDPARIHGWIVERIHVRLPRPRRVFHQPHVQHGQRIVAFAAGSFELLEAQDHVDRRGNDVVRNGLERKRHPDVRIDRNHGSVGPERNRHHAPVGARVVVIHIAVVTGLAGIDDTVAAIRQRQSGGAELDRHGLKLHRRDVHRAQDGRAVLVVELRRPSGERERHGGIAHDQLPRDEVRQRNMLDEGRVELLLGNDSRPGGNVDGHGGGHVRRHAQRQNEPDQASDDHEYAPLSQRLWAAGAGSPGVVRSDTADSTAESGGQGSPAATARRPPA